MVMIPHENGQLEVQFCFQLLILESQIHYHAQPVSESTQVVLGYYLPSQTRYNKERMIKPKRFVLVATPLRRLFANSMCGADFQPLLIIKSQ